MTLPPSGSYSNRSSGPIGEAANVGPLSSQGKALPPQDKIGAKDSISKTKGEAVQQNPSETAGQIGQPVLGEPDSPISFSEFISSVSSALFSSKTALEASQRIKDLSNMRSSEAIVEQAESLNNVIAARKKAVDDINQTTETASNTLNGLVQTISQSMSAEQALINQLNAGNLQEQQAFQDFIDAYNTYMAQLKSIGVEDQGNGTYLVPEDSVDAYNTYTAEFQKATNDFNAYWNDRSNEIDAYNDSASSYNADASKNNQDLSNFSSTYETDPLPKQPTASSYQAPSIPDKIASPPTISSGPAIVTILPPPQDVYTIAKSGVPSLSSLPAYPGFDATLIEGQIFTSLYQQNVSGYDQTINAALSTLSEIKVNSQFTLNEDPPVLNEKPLLGKLLDEFFKEKKDGNEGIDSPLNNEERKVAKRTVLSKNIEKVLSRELLQKEIKEFLPNIDEATSETILDQLGTLSFVLLQNQALRAVYPGFSLVSSLLEEIPSDDPSFGAAFALSFLNRIKEELLLGTSGKAIESFIQTLPELKALKPAQTAALKSSIETGLLLTGLNVVEKNLSLPGLSYQLLMQAAPSKEVVEKIQSSLNAGESKSSQEEGKLAGHFKKKGYQEKESHFLAKMGLSLIEQHLCPRAAALSPKTVDIPLLKDSLTTLLLLSEPSLSLEKATSFSESAIKELQTSSPISIKKAKSVLAGHLKEIGFKDEVAKQTDLLLFSPVRIDLKKMPPLPLSSLKTIVEKRAEELFVPSVAEEAIPKLLFALFGEEKPPVTKEKDPLLETLFSTHLRKNSDRITANESEPAIPRVYSTEEILQSRFDFIKSEKQESFADKQFEAFSETIRSSQDLNYFLEQLMNPANLFIYSIFSGIIYPSRKRDQQLII